MTDEERAEDVGALLAEQRELLERLNTRIIERGDAQHAQIQAVLALCETWIDIPATASSTFFATQVLECLGVSR